MASTPTRVVLAAGVVSWLATVLASLIVGAPLGHDEAQYALASQQFVTGVGDSSLYLSRGMDLVAAPGILCGGSELALRVVPVLVGLAFLAATAQLARRVTSDATAAWVVCVLAGSLAFMRRSTDLLSDLPSTTCLIVATTIVVTELVLRPRAATSPLGPRWHLVLAAPWLAGAFYLRYGSVIPIAIIGVVGVSVSLAVVIRRPLPVLATAIVLAVLLVPHLVLAVRATGSAFGIMGESSDVISKYFGSGLVHYVLVNPFMYYGLATTPVLVIGLGALRRDRRVVMLWLVAALDIVALGLTTLAQSRYIYFPLTLLIILGTDSVRRWFAAHPSSRGRRLERVAAVFVAASCLATAILAVVVTVKSRRHFAPLGAAIAAIRKDRHEPTCIVVGRNSPQLEWYTGCLAMTAAPPGDLGRIYVVRITEKPYQPDLRTLPGVQTVILTRGDVLVVRLDPP